MNNPIPLYLETLEAQNKEPQFDEGLRELIRNYCKRNGYYNTSKEIGK